MPTGEFLECLWAIFLNALISFLIEEVEPKDAMKKKISNFLEKQHRKVFLVTLLFLFLIVLCAHFFTMTGSVIKGNVLTLL